MKLQPTKTVRAKGALLAGTAALSIAVAGCGSSSTKTTASGSSGSQASTAASTTKIAAPAFNGAEATLPTTFKTPQVKPGTTFVLGYLSPQGGVQLLDTEQAAAAAEAKALGGKEIAYSVNSNPSTQVADFSTLLTQGVTAIAFQPLDPTALAPSLAKAAAKGIPIIASSTPSEANEPLLPGYRADVLQSVDQCAYDNVKAVAAAKPGATWALIGTALPYPSLTELMDRTKYWATKFGLKYVGSASTGSGIGASDGSTAMSAILAQHPTVNAVFGWDDTVAEGAAVKARTASGHIMVVGSNGDTAAIEQIKQGTMFATCKVNGAQLGKELAIAAYEEQTKQNIPLPTKIVIAPTEITQANAG